MVTIEMNQLCTDQKPEERLIPSSYCTVQTQSLPL